MLIDSVLGLEQRFDLLFDFFDHELGRVRYAAIDYVLACMCHPRFKLRWIDSVEKIKKACLALIVEEISKLEQTINSPRARHAALL